MGNFKIFWKENYYTDFSNLEKTMSNFNDVIENCNNFNYSTDSNCNIDSLDIEEIKELDQLKSICKDLDITLTINFDSKLYDGNLILESGE